MGAPIGYRLRGFTAGIGGRQVGGGGREGTGKGQVGGQVGGQVHWNSRTGIQEDNAGCI